MQESMREVVQWITQKSKRRFHTSGQLRVREHYTHDALVWVRVLDGHTSSEAPRLSGPVLIPSVAVLRAALPLLEDRCFPLQNCVFLQSVLRVLSDALTAREYRTLCKALANGFVDAHVLLNEQTPSTWTRQQPEQPAEQHIAELVKRAYQAVAQQFPDAAVQICVVDKENDPFASILDLPVCTFEEALEQSGGADPAVVHRFEALAARIQAKGETSLRKTGAPTEYPRYLPDKDVADGLKTGRLLEGTIHVLPHNPREAEVHVEQGGSTSVYLVQGRHHMNRALNGDRVCVQVLPRAEWAVPASQRSLTFESEPVDERDEAETDELLDEAATTTNDTLSTATDDAIPTAKVVGCTRRQYNKYVCTILRESLTKEEGRDEYVLAIPLDKTIPKLRMRTKQGHALAGQRIVVQFDDWPEDSMYPNGHFITVIGDAGDWHVEVATLLHEKGLVFPPFSTAALACLPPVPVPVEEQPGQSWVDSMWTPSETEASGRKDLRDLRIFSIDPPGCQDIDDAMSVRWLDDATLEVGVHIADVTHFLQQGSPLDRAAQQRATTVYLVHKRFDMLPKLLSSDICSLHQDKDRYAFSVLWRMNVCNSDGRKVTRADPIALDRVLKFIPQEQGVWVGKTIIHSCAAMTYYQADRLVHDLPPDPVGAVFPPKGQAGQAVPPNQWEGLRSDVKLLTLIARHFRSLRMGSGALELTGGGSELKFRLDADGNPVEVSSKADEEIHHTIAELMILANSTVASTIRSVFPLDSLLRKHPPPQSQKVRELNTLTNVLGVSFDDQDARAMQEALDQLGKPSAGDHDDDTALATQSLVTSLLIRAMNEAQYVCTGAAIKGNQQLTTISTDDATIATSLGHYGLGLSNYTHFTSPIRRYADVIVHRQLAAAICFLRSEHFAGNSGLAAYDIYDLGIGFNPHKLPRWDPWRDEPLPRTEVPPLVVPASSTISVEAMWKGEAQEGPVTGADVDLDMAADEDFLDDLLDDVVDFAQAAPSAVLAAAPSAGNYAAALTQQPVEQGQTEAAGTAPSADVDATELEPPYSMATLARMCVHLNEMNRRAKAASMDCQKLFLTLYFKDHVAQEPAVIYEVKDNGFLVYVPKYDLKGAVYLKSRSGTVHSRPQLLGLPATAGAEAEDEFSLLEGCRALPGLTTSFAQEDVHGVSTNVLRIQQGGKPLARFQPMDVVTVQITGRRLGAVQRAPTLRFDLVALGQAVQQQVEPQSRKALTATILEAITHEEPSSRSRAAGEREGKSSLLSVAHGWAVLPGEAKPGRELPAPPAGTLMDSKMLPRVQNADLVWRDASVSAESNVAAASAIYECAIDLLSSFGLSGALYGAVDESRISESAAVQEADEKALRKVARRRQKLREQAPRKLIGKGHVVRRIRFQGYQPPVSQLGLYSGEEQKAGEQERTAEVVRQPGWSQEYAELEELPGFGIGSTFQPERGAAGPASSSLSQQELNRQVNLATQRTQRLRAEKRHYSKPKG